MSNYATSYFLSFSCLKRAIIIHYEKIHILLLLLLLLLLLFLMRVYYTPLKKRLEILPLGGNSGDFKQDRDFMNYLNHGKVDIKCIKLLQHF